MSARCFFHYFQGVEGSETAETCFSCCLHQKNVGSRHIDYVDSMSCKRVMRFQNIPKTLLGRGLRSDGIVKQLPAIASTFDGAQLQS